MEGRRPGRKTKRACAEKASSQAEVAARFDERDDGVDANDRRVCGGPQRRVLLQTVSVSDAIAYSDCHSQSVANSHSVRLRIALAVHFSIAVAIHFSIALAIHFSIALAVPIALSVAGYPLQD